MPQTDGGDRRVLPRDESGDYTLKWGEVNATGQHKLPHKFKDTSGCWEPGGASERRPALEHFRQWCQDGEKKGVYTGMFRSSVAQKGAGWTGKDIWSQISPCQLLHDGFELHLSLQKPGVESNSYHRGLQCVSSEMEYVTHGFGSWVRPQHVRLSRQTTPDTCKGPEIKLEPLAGWDGVGVRVPISMLSSLMPRIGCFFSFWWHILP